MCYLKKSLFALVLMYFCSCQNIVNKNEDVTANIQKLIGKEVFFPTTYQMKPKIYDYVILSYVDSIGCTSCRLDYKKWSQLQQDLQKYKATVLLSVYTDGTKKQEIKRNVRRHNLQIPIIFDEHDSLNLLNSFSSDERFQTLLLNGEFRVVAVGNPVLNPQIKELYLKIIQGQPIEEGKETIQTQVAVPETSFTFGDFSWQEAQTHTFEVKNTGSKPLVIQDVTTSCGCITVDFTKEPVQPGGTAVVTVTYKADRAEYFNKTVTVYGNAEQFPFSLHVSGNAK